MLQQGALIALVFAIVGIYLLDDPFVPPRAVVIAFVVACAGAAFAADWLARPRAVGWRPPLVYVGYVVVLLAVYAAAPTDDARVELGRQLVFLLVVLAAALASSTAHGASALVATHLAGVTLVLVQIPGPRSGVDPIGRLLYYHALPQWSGYPEIGLLMALGASMAMALVLTRRRALVQLAAGVLACASTVAAAWIGSRSAVLTIGVTVAWLTVTAAVRWRGRLATGAAVLLVAAVAWGLASGPGPVERLERASARVAVETSIRSAGWQAATTMIREHPWLGVGLGRYGVVYRAREMGSDASHAYNMLLHVAAESGLIGLAACLALWGRALWISLRAASRTPDGAMAFAVHAALVAFLVRSQSEHFLANLWTSTRMLLLVATLVGLAEGVRRGAATARTTA